MIVNMSEKATEQEIAHIIERARQIILEISPIAPRFEHYGN